LFLSTLLLRTGTGCSREVHSDGIGEKVDFVEEKWIEEGRESGDRGLVKRCLGLLIPRLLGLSNQGSQRFWYWKVLRSVWSSVE